MEEAAKAMKQLALSGSKSASGAYEKLVETSREAKAGPWRPYIEIYVKRFDKSLSYGEMLEQVNAVYDYTATFSNNFITTVGGTDNAVAVWRYLVAPMKSIDLVVEGITVRFTPDPTRAEAPGAGAAGQGVGVSEAAGGRLELEILSNQRWHLPSLLVLVRWVFGDILCVRVTSTITIDPITGRVVDQRDWVHNWLSVPFVLRVLLGLTLPLITAIIRP